MDVDFELNKHEFSNDQDPVNRTKTPLRMKYEAEARAFLTRHGGLENIRKTLGFSQRKMGQILMVDPSAWSRWIRDESRTPPHICRSLEWLLQLEGKNPEILRVLAAGLMSGGRGGDDKVLASLIDKTQKLEREVETLNRRKLTEISKIMTLLIGLFALALLLILVK